jgi:16S rRNA (cytosine967-C5)-methyltransferase
MSESNRGARPGRGRGRTGHGRSGSTAGRGVDPARRAAYDVLHDVGSSDAYANLALRQVLADRRLDSRDAAFTTELVMGVLRQRGVLDPVLAECVDRPLAKLDPRVLDVLRLGAYQVLFLHTADFAAVNSSVDLAGAVCGGGPRGLVNAVLRKVANHDVEQWRTRLDSAPGQSSVQRLAVRHSHPAWIVSALRDSLNGDEQALEQLLSINNEPPTVTLAARPGRSEPAELLDVPGAQPGRWSPWAVRLTAGNPGNLPQVRDQSAGVQDEGSQLMVQALVSAPLSGTDTTWLDMCAGPGGKAALLAGVADSRGARVLSVELRAARAKLVQRSLRGAPGTWGVVQADARTGLWLPGSFDRVLLDAPCTGLGVLRRRPESRWRRTPRDIAALAPLQRDLLASAVSAVRPGGVVAYVTCSPHIAETDLIVDEFLADRSDVVEESARDLLADHVPLPPGPRIRLWPHEHDTDAMFCALLRRV